MVSAEDLNLVFEEPKWDERTMTYWVPDEFKACVGKLGYWSKTRTLAYTAMT